MGYGGLPAQRAAEGGRWDSLTTSRDGASSETTPEAAAEGRCFYHKLPTQFVTIFSLKIPTSLDCLSLL